MTNSERTLEGDLEQLQAMYERGEIDLAVYTTAMELCHLNWAAPGTVASIPVEEPKSKYVLEGKFTEFARTTSHSYRYSMKPMLLSTQEKVYETEDELVRFERINRNGPGSRIYSQVWYEEKAKEFGPIVLPDSPHPPKPNWVI